MKFMHKSQFTGLVAVLAAGVAVGGAGQLRSAEVAESPGQQAYAENCAACHGRTMTGGGFGPALVGAAFKAKWSSSDVSLLDFIRQTMPPMAPDSLSAETYEAITAHIAAANGLSMAGVAAGAGQAGVGQTGAGQTGEAAAPASLPPPSTDSEGGLAAAEENEDSTYQSAMAQRADLLARMRPVDEAMLQAPPAADWLMARRTYDNQGFSPLQAIDRANVGGLQVAWSISLPAGSNQITPLVHDGVMFVQSAGTVIALDAATGDTLWRFHRPASVAPQGPPISNPRSMAMFSDRLFVPTIDNHIIALDARTGKVVWDHLIEGGGIYRLTSGPIYVKGKIIQGVSGCAGGAAPGGCYIVALDAKDGRELWRFHTIARPGTKHGDSWNGAALEERFGGAIWSTPAYDPRLDLVFVGAAQTYVISPLMNRKPGGNNDALYTNSTLALDPDTGKLVWHYQHQQREVWDFDWAFERTLIQLPSRPAASPAVMTMGKLGILDVLDAKTGKYLFSADVGDQTLVTHIDPRTGRKTTDPAMEPAANEPRYICPHAAGVRNWPATSYNPVTGKLYVAAAINSCMDYVWRPKEEWELSYVLRPRKDGDGNFGALVAMDVAGRETVWSRRHRASEASAVLATASGLVFEGGRDRRFRASDEATGDVLWETRLDNVPSASPITFEAGGRQLVSISTGGGAPMDASRAALTPEIERAVAATTLWVFALPGKADAPDGKGASQ